jgi:lysozyme
MINQSGLDMIKYFEEFRAEAYRDSVGVWTIGFGTTAMAGAGIVPKAGMVISYAEAEGYLRDTLARFGAKIAPKITAPINENEWAAFLSLAYNIGPVAFARSSALKKFNAGDKAGAADAILLWDKAGGKVLAGLRRRRAAERALFLKPVKPLVLTPKQATPAVIPVLPTVTAENPPTPAKSPRLGLGAAIMAVCAAALYYFTKG